MTPDMIPQLTQLVKAQRADIAPKGLRLSIRVYRPGCRRCRLDLRSRSNGRLDGRFAFENDGIDLLRLGQDHVWHLAFIRQVNLDAEILKVFPSIKVYRIHPLAKQTRTDETERRKFFQRRLSVPIYPDTDPF
jgi:hypothetical protein